MVVLTYDDVRKFVKGSIDDTEKWKFETRIGDLLTDLFLRLTNTVWVILRKLENIVRIFFFFFLRLNIALKIWGNNNIFLKCKSYNLT